MKTPSNFRSRTLFFALAALALAALACQSILPVSSVTAPVAIQDNVGITTDPTQTDPEASPLALREDNDSTSKIGGESVPILYPAADANYFDQNTLIDIYEAVSPGVVAIRTLSELGEGLGSGFLVDMDGHIVTNYHVIADVTEVEVAFPNGFKVTGTVIGQDLDSDLAIIKVDAPAEELHPIPLGSYADLKVGQFVVAIGNPFGLSGTMTSGIVSAKGRVLDSMNAGPGGSVFSAGDLIQTDTAVNPGNSGGPLLNLNGEVVGINRAIRTETFSGDGSALNSGISFAISVDILKRVMPDLIENGAYNYPYLGVSSFPEITLLIQQQLDLPQSTGAYITNIVVDGPSDLAGLRTGDIVTHIDGVKVLVFGDLLSYLINNKSPGDEVILTVLRNEEPIEVTVIIASRP